MHHPAVSKSNILIRNRTKNICQNSFAAHKTYQFAVMSLSTTTTAHKDSSSFAINSFLQKVQKSAFENAKIWFKKYEETMSASAGSNVSLADWADYRNHAAFYEKKKSDVAADSDSSSSSSGSVGGRPNPIASQLKRSLYSRHVLPQTLAIAKELDILQDCLGNDLARATPDILPIQVELQFDVVEARNWRGTYGQFIDPSSTMQSPKVTLTLPPSQTASDDALYTILLNDLDAPLLENESFEEWCHWLVTDVAIGKDGSVTLPSSFSKYLVEKSQSPVVQSIGHTVFDYVPMHPALSNPKTQHRYVLTVWQQSKGEKLAPKLKAAKDEWRIFAQKAKSKAASLFPPHRRLHDGERESAMDYRERFLAFPTLKFADSYGLSLKGLAHYTSGFTVDTPLVFKQLGLHQPVYGPPIKAGTEHVVVSKLETSTAIAKNVLSSTTNIKEAPSGDESISLSTAALKDIDRHTLKRLNHGYRQDTRPPPLVTRRDLKYLSAQQQIQETDGKKKKTSGVADASAVVAAAKNGVKRVHLTVWGAAGIARAEAGFKGGEVVGKVKDRRNRYENV